MVEEPEVIKGILADDEEVIDKWYLRGLLIRSYLFITNRRGFIYTKGIIFMNGLLILCGEMFLQLKVLRGDRCYH